MLWLSLNLIFILFPQIIHLTYCKDFTYNVNDDKLIFAQTLCCHGDRNPVKFFPTDPFNSPIFWPEGFGALTEVGRQQHFTLGKYLRNRYAELLGKGRFFSNTVRVQSTDKERTLLSTEANLAGFLSFPNYRMFNDFLSLQPIPIVVFPEKEDYLLTSSVQCDRLNYLVVEYLKKDNNYEAFWRHFGPLVSYLEEKTGMKINSILELAFLYDGMGIERSKNLTLPEWADKVMNPGGDLEAITLFWYQLHSTTPEMRRLRGGYLLKEIFDRFLNKTQSILPSDLSLWMYFAHDTTIVNALKSLNMYEVQLPPMASCLFFELYESKEDHYVRIFYRNSTESDVPSLEIPNCGKKCPLHKLYDLYKDVLPTRSFDVECALREGEILPPGGNPENYAE